MTSLDTFTAAMRAGEIRDRLDQMRALDADQADEVEEIWPLTLASLDGPENVRVVDLPAWRMQELLARELADRIAEASPAEDDAR